MKTTKKASREIENRKIAHNDAPGTVDLHVPGDNSQGEKKNGNLQ